MDNGNAVTRRSFVKGALYIGSGLFAAAGLGAGWKKIKRLAVEQRPADLSAKLEGDRTRTSPQWFSSAELATIAALTSLIIPSDGEGPGAKEVGLQWRIDEMVAGTPRIQGVYREGLVGLNALAERRYQHTFVSLDPERQAELMRMIEEAKAAMDVEATTAVQKTKRKLSYWYYYRWMGVTAPVAEFVPRIVQDAKIKFYSSREAWAWLGYEGPPFPLGYFSKPDRCHIAQA